VKITRYRCTNCGNVTRFDVISTVTSKAFHHYTVGGELSVGSEEILNHSVAEVSCRWCGSSAGVTESESES
jgi:predicted nucleic acid-binding Zn ribbon protein